MQLFANNADTSLNGAITSTTTVITVKAGEGSKFPSPTNGDYFLVTLFQRVGTTEFNHEVVKCTSRTGDNLTVVRAQEGTSAFSFNSGDWVELRFTKGSAENFVQKEANKHLSTEDYTTAEKSKLSGIAAGANNYSHPTGDGNQHVPATGTANSGKVLKAGSAAGSFAWGNVAYSEVTGTPTLGTAAGMDTAATGDAGAGQVVLGSDTRLSNARPASDVSEWAKAATKPAYTKSEVGLGNVDNTSDSAKPISTATQTALNAKAPLNGAGTSGTWPINVSGRSGAFDVIDDRNVVSQPNQVPDRSGVFNFRFKENVGNPPFPANYMYAHVLTVNGWTADGTGGWPTQVSFGERLSYRKGATSTTWGAWRQLIDSSSIGEFAPSLTGTGATGNWGISVTGNAATATKLATARTINGIAFDGSANISVPVDWSSVTGKPAVIAVGADKVLARAAIDAVSVDEVITPFVLVTATNQPAVAGVQYGLSNAAATTLTLPASPLIETLVWVVVLNNRSDNVLARNGNLIGGLAENMTIDNPRRPFAAKFIGGAIGWAIL